MLETLKITSSDSKWQAEIAPSHGADIISLKYEGKDVYNPVDMSQYESANPFLHGSAILIPANRTYKGEFWFEGKKYTLPINDRFSDSNLHGCVYKQRFEVVSCISSAVELCFENRGEVYPFPFALTVRYEATDGGFCQHYTVKNVGSRNMPLTFALHTAFSEPERFSVPLECCLEKDEKHIPTGRYVPLSQQQKAWVSDGRSKDRVITGYFKSSGQSATVDEFSYSVSDNFDHWILFNGMGKIGVLCLEPQCGKVNGLNLPDGCRILAPNEELKFYTEISV